MFVAHGHWIAAFSPIDQRATPILAENLSCIELQQKAVSAGICAAPAFFSTALFVISGGAIPVITIDVRCITPQLCLKRTIKLTALALRLTAGVHV